MTSDPARNHPPENAIDGTEQWWQSPPLSRGMRYNEVNLTIDLGQVSIKDAFACTHQEGTVPVPSGSIVLGSQRKDLYLSIPNVVPPYVWHISSSHAV